MATKPRKGWHWWMVDLQENFLIKYIRIANRNNPKESTLINFHVEISKLRPQTLSRFPGRTNASLCLTQNTQVPKGGPMEYHCSRAEVGRYVRLLRSFNSARSLIMCEFEVYGDPVSDTLTKSDTDEIRSVPPSIEQTTFLWRFKHVASEAKSTNMKSTASLAVINSCARSRIRSHYNITTLPFVQVDFPSGYCRFLQTAFEANSSPSLSWMLYELDIS